MDQVTPDHRRSNGWIGEAEGGAKKKSVCLVIPHVNKGSWVFFNWFFWLFLFLLQALMLGQRWNVQTSKFKYSFLSKIQLSKRLPQFPVILNYKIKASILL